MAKAKTMVDYEIQIALTIRNFKCDPAEITAQIQVTPWRVAVRGEKSSERNLPRSNLWILRSDPESASATLNDHWNNILAKLRGKEGVLQSLSLNSDLKFTIIVGIENEKPVLVFSKEQIEFVAGCGASLEID